MEINTNEYIELANLHYNNKHFKVYKKGDNQESFIFEIIEGRVLDINSEEKGIIEAIYAEKEREDVVYNNDENLPTLSKAERDILEKINYVTLMCLVNAGKKLNSVFHVKMSTFLQKLCKNAPWLLSKTAKDNLIDLEFEAMRQEEYIKVHNELSAGCYAPVENKVYFNAENAYGETFDHEMMHVLVVPKGHNPEKSAIDEGIQEIIRGESFDGNDLSYQFPSAMAKILTEIIGTTRMKQIYKHRTVAIDKQVSFRVAEKTGIPRDDISDFLDQLNKYTQVQPRLEYKKIENDYAKRFASLALDYYFADFEKKYSKIDENKKDDELDKMMFSLSRVDNVISDLTSRILKDETNQDIEKITETFNELKETNLKKISKANGYKYLNIINELANKKQEYASKCEEYKYFPKNDHESLKPFAIYTIEEHEDEKDKSKEVTFFRRDTYAYLSETEGKDYDIKYNKYKIVPGDAPQWITPLLVTFTKEDLPRNGEFRQASYKIDNNEFITNPQIITDAKTTKGEDALVEMEEYVQKRETIALENNKVK